MKKFSLICETIMEIIIFTLSTMGHTAPSHQPANRAMRRAKLFKKAQLRQLKKTKEWQHVTGPSAHPDKLETIQSFQTIQKTVMDIFSQVPPVPTIQQCRDQDELEQLQRQHQFIIKRTKQRSVKQATAWMTYNLLNHVLNTDVIQIGFI